VPDELLSVIQLFDALAVHEHWLPVVSTVELLPDVAGSDWLVGVSEYEQVLPACDTASVLPAIVTLPDRVVEPVLAAIEIVAVPGPSPDPPAPTVIHETLLVVDQAHPTVVLTFVEPVPAIAGTVIDVGEMPYVHAAAA
jgi:hypothetical protein